MKPLCQIAFGKIEFKTEAVVKVLQMGDLVEDILLAFERRFN